MNDLLHQELLKYVFFDKPFDVTPILNQFNITIDELRQKVSEINENRTDCTWYWSDEGQSMLFHDSADI